MLFDLFFQDVVNINPRCNYRCGFCTYWKVSASELPHISSQRQLRDYVKKIKALPWYSRPRIVHLVGGEPLQSPLLFQALSQLKSVNVKVWMWTNLKTNTEVLDLSAPFVDQWAVYIPSSEPDQFRVISGDPEWGVFSQSLDYLANNLTRKVFLHYPLRSETVEDSAHVYEFAYYRNIRLMLHFGPESYLSRDSVEFVERFYKVPKVWVFRVPVYLKNYCQALPILGVKSTWQWLKNGVYYYYGRFFSL
jgi:sulfatase maturation enzyme AslB (radical SAM superfamily)